MGRKSAKIAAKKGAADKAKSLLYTKALRDITSAVKSGGTDSETNFLLKVALERCRKFNVPKDNIDRAIKKAEGGDGADYQDINYEGYGPGGVSIFVEASTNNVTRTVANVRSYFNKNGGSLATSGALEFIFERKSTFVVPKEGLDEDEFTLEMIEAGAEEIETDLENENCFKVLGPVSSFGSIQKSLQALNITPDEANLQRFPTNLKTVSEDDEPALDKLIDLLESDEDVVTVYHNIEEEDE